MRLKSLIPQALLSGFKPVERERGLSPTHDPNEFLVGLAGNTTRDRTLLGSGNFQDALLATLSHEVRTALTNIIGCSDMIRNVSASLPPEVEDSTITIMESSDHLLQMVDQIRLLANLDEDHVEVTHGPTNINDILYGVSERLTQHAINRNFAVTVTNDLSDLWYNLDARGICHVLGCLTDIFGRLASKDSKVELSVFTHPSRADKSKVGLAFRIGFLHSSTEIASSLTRLLERGFELSPAGHLSETQILYAVASKLAMVLGGTVLLEPGMNSSIVLDLVAVSPCAQPATNGGTSRTISELSSELASLMTMSHANGSSPLASRKTSFSGGMVPGSSASSSSRTSPRSSPTRSAHSQSGPPTATTAAPAMSSARRTSAPNPGSLLASTPAQYPPARRHSVMMANSAVPVVEKTLATAVPVIVESLAAVSTGGIESVVAATAVPFIVGQQQMPPALAIETTSSVEKFTTTSELADVQPAAPTMTAEHEGHSTSGPAVPTPTPAPEPAPVPIGPTIATTPAPLAAPEPTTVTAAPATIKSDPPPPPTPAPAAKLWVCPADAVLVPPRTIAQRQVLVVEDDTINQRIIRALLRKLGYTNVTFASDGADALFHYNSLVEERSYFDIILLDQSLPTLSGDDTCYRIRQSDRTQVIISCSANTRLTGDSELCRALGYDDCVTKPLFLETLKKIMDRWTAAGDARRLRHIKRRLKKEAILAGFKVTMESFGLRESGEPMSPTELERLHVDTSAAAQFAPNSPGDSRKVRMAAGGQP
ncbi:hypothetical protein BC828DRAFT_260846 [Blastocladiella britannica]|nr:hypothetical protein BC828DRAFT_260846 [Blastocladiella britannica]